MRCVCALNMALQLEGSGELTVAVLASGVLFPALTALLLKFQMMLHMVHKPGKELSIGTKFKLKYSTKISPIPQPTVI